MTSKKGFPDRKQGLPEVLAFHNLGLLYRSIFLVISLIKIAHSNRIERATLDLDSNILDPGGICLA